MKGILLLAFVAVARAAHLHQAVHPPVAVGPAKLIEEGSSRVQRTEDNQGNYAFGYDEVHTSGGSFRREQANANGGVTGSYGLRDADGRLRTVNYIADAAGFRVAITSNEPGVESKNSAGALWNSGEVPPGPVVDETLLEAPAAPLIAAAPLVSAPAPVAHAHPLPAPAPVAPLNHGHFFSQSLHGPHAAHLTASIPAVPAAAPVVAPAPPPVHGGFLSAGPPSAPVLATPAGATPTVLNNPLTEGRFASFARPAISTPQALATAPLAAPLNHFSAAPLAAPAVATNDFHNFFAAPAHFRAAPVAPVVAAPAPVAPVVAAPAPVAPVNHGHFFGQRLVAPVAAAPVAHGPVHAPLQAHTNFFAQPAAPLVAAPAPIHAHAAPAAIAGMSYSTTVNHAHGVAPLVAGPAPHGHGFKF